MADDADLPLFDDAVAWEDAQRRLEALELGDGLPLVPPTAARIARMLAGVADPARSWGALPPMFGELTAEAVAYQCVLAGCRPAELPVVLAAATACLEPEFNLLGLLTTTGTPAVATIVHGPIARALGVNSGANCLGPGARANACIGRAVALVLRNIAGARPAIGDMATMGQPGKYTFCFAEGYDPTFPTLAARHGLGPDDSAVTMLGVSGTAEMLPHHGGETPESILTPVREAMAAAGDAAGAGRRRPGGEQFFLLPPELAGTLHRHGWGLAETRRFLADGLMRDGEPSVAAKDIHPVAAGGAGIKMTLLPLWMGGTRSVTRRVVAP